MYNEELENLIDAALTDGVLTEKEKQILFKKAQSMGVDLDEFEMVLDARLVKLKKAEEEKTASSAPKSNKFGDVKKCPSCGAIVQRFQGACPECGYVFEGLAANSSSQRLADKIDEIMKETSAKTEGALSNKGRNFLGAFYDNALSGQLRVEQAEESARKRILEVIENFPIPNTKADLLEFIITMKTKSKSNQFASAYFSKYTECIEKARFLFPNDKDFAPFISSYSKGGGLKRWWKSAPKKTKVIIGVILFNVLLWIALGIVFAELYAEYY